MGIVFHYPPELLNLLIDTIPRICRSKNDVLLFFTGSGVSNQLLADLRVRLNSDPSSINKFEIARTVLTRLNERGESGLEQRRQVLRRVVECDDFSTCWPEDQLKAKGLIAEIRRVTDTKDSFTRIRLELDREAAARRTELAVRQRKVEASRKERDEAKAEFFATFGERNAQHRGRRLEACLNRLFKAHGISVREPFRVVGHKGAGVIEQIDGVIELQGHLYLVEMKWLSDDVSVPDVSHHLVRVYHRGQTRGFFFSSTNFTRGALNVCKEALQRTVVVLCLLEELVALLEREGDLAAFLKAKAEIAQVHKEPFHLMLGDVASMRE